MYVSQHLHFVSLNVNDLRFPPPSKYLMGEVKILSPPGSSMPDEEGVDFGKQFQ